MCTHYTKGYALCRSLGAYHPLDPPSEQGEVPVSLFFVRVPYPVPALRLVQFSVLKDLSGVARPSFRSRQMSFFSARKFWNPLQNELVNFQS